MTMCSLSAIVLLSTAGADGNFTTEGAWAVDGAAAPLSNCPYHWTAQEKFQLHLLEPLLRQHYVHTTDFAREYNDRGSCTCCSPAAYFLNVLAASARKAQGPSRLFKSPNVGESTKSCLDVHWAPAACSRAWLRDWTRPFAPTVHKAPRRHSRGVPAESTMLPLFGNGAF